jgi:hypothetical protein
MRLLPTIAVALAVIPSPWLDDAPSRPATRPVFSGGALVRPEGYQTWPMVGASLGLSYAENPQGGGPGAFHRVYMNPSSYEAYVRTGAFPDGTMFVLELYAAHEKTAPAKAGYFEGPRVGLEASVKDTRRFPSGWAYFGFENGARATATPFPEGRCHACHVDHAARDSVFVQFYPTLRDR